MVSGRRCRAQWTMINETPGARGLMGCGAGHHLNFVERCGGVFCCCFFAGPQRFVAGHNFECGSFDRARPVPARRDGFMEGLNCCGRGRPRSRYDGVAVCGGGDCGRVGKQGDPRRIAWGYGGRVRGHDARGLMGCGNRIDRTVHVAEKGVYPGLAGMDVYNLQRSLITDHGS